MSEIGEDRGTSEMNAQEKADIINLIHSAESFMLEAERLLAKHNACEIERHMIVCRKEVGECLREVQEHKQGIF